MNNILITLMPEKLCNGVVLHDYVVHIHCVKYARIRVFSRIRTESGLIQENTDQGKLVPWHILRSDNYVKNF